MPRDEKKGYYKRPNGRWHGDFREYPRDVVEAVTGSKTGQHVALVPPGEKLATKDRKVAGKVYTDLLNQLTDARQAKGLNGGNLPSTLRLEAFALEFVRARNDRPERYDPKRTAWLADVALFRAVNFFGSDRTLVSIQKSDVARWIKALESDPGPTARDVRLKRDQGVPLPKYERLQPQSVKNHLYAFSLLYEEAAELYDNFPDGYNPVKLIRRKPQSDETEAESLEVWEAALLLEAARVVRSPRQDLAAPFMYPLLATFLLTGGRKQEVLGLELGDVDLENGQVLFRKSARRRLKNRSSVRPVAVWPQLREILEPYVAQRAKAVGNDPTALLFPGKRPGSMLTDFRKALKRVVEAAGLPLDRVHPHCFRHTYCSVRLQTLDGGRPVAAYTVCRELGHSDLKMIEQRYAHLGKVRHRSDVVEYRVEQWMDLPEFAGRLAALHDRANAPADAEPKVQPAVQRCTVADGRSVERAA